MPVNDLVAMAERGVRRPQVNVARPKQRQERRENAEFVAIALLVQNWDAIATWLVESLFADDVYRRAFLAVAESGGDLDAALDAADPEARDVLERAAVVDVDADPASEARNLISAAVRRELAERATSAGSGADPRRCRSSGADGAAERRRPGPRCGGLVARLAGRTHGGTHWLGDDPVKLSTVPPPLEGVDRSEWDALVTRGRADGELHAEQVAHVLRHVELTGDALLAVNGSLTGAGITDRRDRA